MRKKLLLFAIFAIFAILASSMTAQQHTGFITPKSLKVQKTKKIERKFEKVGRMSKVKAELDFSAIKERKLIFITNPKSLKLSQGEIVFFEAEFLNKEGEKEKMSGVVKIVGVMEGEKLVYICKISAQER